MEKDTEELRQGNISKVTRNGNIVYRDLKPQSSTVHRLLLHLENKGVTFTPRFLGVDENNQEMLSFMEGDTIEDYPCQKELQSKSVTVQMAAKMLRVYHDATLDFERCPEDIWFLNYEGGLQKEVICHNDFAPYNITFKDNKPVGMIDFDTVCPAPRIWDIAYAVYRFVPLSMEVYDPIRKKYRLYDKTLDCLERKSFINLFINTYGIGNSHEVLQTVIMRLQALVQLFDTECGKGNSAFIKMKEEGHQQFYVNEIAFIQENMSDWI